MKKNIFRIAALVLVGACMTACSSGDDEATNERVNPQGNKDNIVTLTGKIAVPETTRSTVAEDGTSTWTAGDKIAVIYQNKSGSWAKAVGTISTSGVPTSEFTVTLTNPVDCNAKLVYPANNATTSGSYYTTSTLSTQKGTLADIGTNHNIQSSEGDYALVISGETATLNGGTAVPLVNRVCISKFTLKYSDNSAFNASQLKVTGGGNTYTVKPDAMTNEFYIALPPMSGGITVTATGPKNFSTQVTLTEATSVTTDDYGRFIVVDPSTRQASLADRSSSNDWTKTFTGADLKAGEFYNQTLTFTGKIPIAVIAYVGAVENYCTKFIALALEDVPTGGTVSIVENTAAQTATTNWAENHPVLIGTMYNTLVTGASTYDNVQSNTEELPSHHVTGTVSSASRTTAVEKGWRVPCVTDLRYIFQELKTNGPSGTKVMSGITAADPAGIADHTGVYGYGAPVTWQSSAGYYTGSPTLVTYINKLIGQDYNMDSQYYWLSSGVINSSGVLQDKKGWRYSFNKDYFIWTATSDEALIRLVLAY